MPNTAAPPLLQPNLAQKTDLMPQWHVILFNDEEHTFEFVIEMIVRVFGHTVSKAQDITLAIHACGQGIADTTTRERAELKQEQVHSYGADWRMGEASTGSIKCEITPAV